MGYLLKRAQSALNAALTAALTDHGVTLPQYAVLTALDEEPGLSNADLARRAFVTPQTMNQVLRELEGKRLVLRRPHSVHGRVLQSHLTADGRRALSGCRRAVDAVEARMLAHLPAAPFPAGCGPARCHFPVVMRCHGGFWLMFRLGPTMAYA